MYHYVSIVYLIYRFCGRTTCGYARYLQQKQLGRQCRWRRSWCCREMLPRQTSWWPRRWRDPLRHHRQDEVVRWRWWRRSQLQWQQELEGWRRERLHGMMDGVGWYRMRCQSVLERICQGNLFFFLVHFLIICLVFEKSQGSAPRWQARWRWRRIQLWFETKFQHQEVHRQQRQEKHRWWRPTGTGTGWFFLLPLLKNTAGKSQMKLKDIESVYIYIYMYLYIESIWKYDAYVFILGKFFHHSVRWRHWSKLQASWKRWLWHRCGALQEWRGPASRRFCQSRERSLGTTGFRRGSSEIRSRKWGHQKWRPMCQEIMK